MKKLKLGFITTVSGRWPRELPNQRKTLYGKYVRELIDADVIELESIVDDQKSLQVATNLFKSSGVDVVVLLYGAFSGDDFAVFLAENLNVPIILWAPKEPPFDGGRLLANALVAATMNSASLKRLGHICHVVYGDYADERVKKELANLLSAYSVIAKMKGKMIGLLGYRPTAFYNSTFDESLIRKTFGIRMESTDLKVVFDNMAKVDKAFVKNDMEQISSQYDTASLPEGHLENHSRLYFALKEVIKEQGYDYCVIKCWPEMGHLKTTPCAVMGRLADEGMLIGCEGDIDAALAMIVQNLLTGLPTFITDLINIDEKENTLTFWHCGNPAPSLFAKGCNPKICNHPLAGQGTAFYCALKEGPVTVARFCNIGGKYKLFLAKGEAVPTTRNTKGAMVNIKINTPVREAIKKIIDEQVPQHYSIVWDDVSDSLKQISKFLNIEIIEI